MRVPECFGNQKALICDEKAICESNKYIPDCYWKCFKETKKREKQKEKNKS